MSETAANEPKKKSHTLRNGTFGCLGLLIVLAIIGAMFGSSPASTPNGNASAIATGDLAVPAAPPVKVSAVQLARAYTNNEARAQSDYGGRPLLVSGTVAGVMLDVLDDPKVQLKTDNPYLSAQATLIDGDKPKAKDFDKGQKVTLLCQDVSEVMSMPMLRDCAVQ